jgi:hypothetical protein
MVPRAREANSENSKNCGMGVDSSDLMDNYGEVPKILFKLFFSTKIIIFPRFLPKELVRTSMEDRPTTDIDQKT